ncbi:MAG: MerR family transcriptional regulator [Myxococcales bacterium]|nr:MAG: MerR family transcriptional regulator [Myxococcales bacterium]
MNETLPKKNFFKLSEVANLLRVKPHEIHFWETEFPQIRSQKSQNGVRIYRKKDVVLFSAVKHLLHERKFTVSGARRVLTESDTMLDEITSTRKEPEVLNTAVLSPAVPAKEGEGKLSLESEILQEAAAILDSQDEYDEQTHKIYQSCADELDDALQINIEPNHAGEILNAAINKQKEELHTKLYLSKAEQQRALDLLMASKKSLNEVLLSLDKIKPSDFWGDF